jgi:SAM-dependent methyltransferase
MTEPLAETTPEGFSADWLSLREPFDWEARNVAARRMHLVEQLQHWRSGVTRPWRIIDLGCGTGSNLRWLAPRLGGAQQWLAVDHDAALLKAWPSVFEATGSPLVDGALDLAKVARWPLPSATVEIVRRQLDLAEHLEALPWQAAELVTASALIDLVGQDWLKRLVAHCRASRAGLLLTLSVDGRHQWHPADRDDGWVSDVFAAHQQRDKGFGPALGARAVPALVQLLRQAGYRVMQAHSDWQVDGRNQPGEQALLASMVDGLAGAVREQQPASSERVSAWRARRLAGALRARLTVGHIDVLALPPARSG